MYTKQAFFTIILLYSSISIACPSKELMDSKSQMTVMLHATEHACFCLVAGACIGCTCAP